MTKVPSEFAEGWPVLVASFIGIAIGVSSLYFYSLGIFIKPMAAEFGWGRGTGSLGALVGTAGAAIMSIPVGRLVDRVGSAPVALVSLVLLAVGFATIGLLTSGLASFLVLTAIVSLVTAGSSPLAFSRLVVSAFDRRRGVALGLTLAGTGVGAILVPRLLAPYVATHGWRSGYLALAGVVAAMLPLLWLFLRHAKDPHRNAAPAIGLGAVLADPAYRLLGVIFLLAATAVLGTVVQFVPMLSDWGLSPIEAGGIASMIGVAAIAGRLLTGVLLDRFSPQRVNAGLFAVAACGLALLAFGGVAFAVPGALVTGVAVGGEVDLIAFLVGRYFRRAVYGAMYGAVYTAFLIGGAIGPALSGYLQEATGSYRASLLVSASLLALAAVASTRLSRLTPMEGSADG